MNRLALILLYAAHLLMVWHAAPPELLLGEAPVFGVDYPTHFGQALALGQALEQFGQTWAWDPSMLAGYPAGLFFDADNKGHALFTHGLCLLGLERPVAFNLFVLLWHLLAPLCVWLAARLLGSSPRARAMSLGLGILLWHFDSAARWYWSAGMISFVAASSLSLVIVALFWRMVRPGAISGLSRGTWRFWAPLLLLLPLALLIHAWAFAILAVPLLGIYAQATLRGELRGSGHARVWSLAVVALAVNLFWLVPALQHHDLMAASGRGGQAWPLTLLTDLMGIFVDPLIGGVIPTLTFFRFAAMGGALFTLLALRRERDPRLFGVGLALLWPFSIAYLFAMVPGLRETEPYRFNFPAALWAAVVAGPWLDRTLRRGTWRALPARLRPVAGLLLLLLLPWAGRQVLYFFPEVMAEPEGVKVPDTAKLHPKPLWPESRYRPFRHEETPLEFKRIARYLTQEAPDPGRVLVEFWVLGEYLRWATERHVIGGFPDRRSVHQESNIFRHLPDPRHTGQALADYLMRYNVRYMVVTVPHAAIEKRPRLLELVRVIGVHRIYRVRHYGNYFEGGSGRVTASLNRLVVDDARPAKDTQELRLRYHYLRTLKCSPDCKVEKIELPYNRTGFIRVVGTPRLAKKIVIENEY